MTTKKTADASPVLAEPITAVNIEQKLTSLWAWISAHAVEIAIAVGVGTAIYLGLAYLQRRARIYAERQPDRLSLAAIIGRTLSKTKQYFQIMVAARLVVGFSEAPDGIVRVVAFLFTVASVFQVAIWAREIILGMIERRASGSDDAGSETLANAMSLIRLLVTVVLFAIASIMVLDNLGVNVTGLIAGLGIGGIAIGLAAQGIFSDLFAALSIIFDKPFKRGETIGFDTTTATVEKIGLKSARLRSITGEEIIISNTNLLGKQIINYTRLNRRRTRYLIGLVYQTSPDRARQVPAMLKEIVEQAGGVFIRCGFVGFGASSIDFELDFDIMSSDFEVVFEGRHRIGLAILERFNAEKLEFAYPTQTTFTAAPDGRMVMPYPEGGFPVTVHDHG
ncbi:small-conductance mechanosensitive channel [Blastomonas natatoria]|uniref:Small-conductance mechanosensitive channel n=1 Tax=Blastomonas natatoria TaxID=34015 RepID=A0A2V3V423_9SPHN|nr:mechanosensitive ion channel domain-containing protein [Blastomonas natatoria]PXW69518.1 small-conductance mechanosensitive channel [Blastomonas natatoria]